MALPMSFWEHNCSKYLVFLSLLHIPSSDPLSNEYSVYLTTRCTAAQLKLSKMNLKDHQARVVRGAHPLSKDRESVVAVYHSMHMCWPSHHTCLNVRLLSYLVLHNSQLWHCGISGWASQGSYYQQESWHNFCQKCLFTCLSAFGFNSLSSGQKEWHDSIGLQYDFRLWVLPTVCQYAINSYRCSSHFALIKF